MVGKTAHRKALEKIVSNVVSFGIKNVVGYSIEMNLLTPRGRILAQPDIVFYTKGDEIWIIEYKGNGNGSYAEKATDQLSKAASWFGRYTPYKLEKIHTKVIAGNNFHHKQILKQNVQKQH